MNFGTVPALLCVPSRSVCTEHLAGRVGRVSRVELACTNGQERAWVRSYGAKQWGLVRGAARGSKPSRSVQAAATARVQGRACIFQSATAGKPRRGNAPSNAAGA